MDYTFLSGQKIEEKLFDKIVKFDNEIFASNDDKFYYDTFIPYETTYNLLILNAKTTVACVDEQNNVVGLLMVLSTNDNFINEYLQEKTSLKELKPTDITNFSKEKHTNFVVYSLGVKDNLRGKKVVSINGTDTTINKALFCEFAKIVIDLISRGIEINKIVSEATSDKGTKISSYLTQGNIVRKCKNGAIIFANEFNYNCFSFLPNYKELNKLL